jgi:hypothetical protein
MIGSRTRSSPRTTPRRGAHAKPREWSNSVDEYIAEARMARLRTQPLASEQVIIAQAVSLTGRAGLHRLRPAS